MGDFTFGVDGLDRFLGDVLRRGSLVVLAGCPGVGKTSLASTICCSNALRGFKCLYLSFCEDREKLFNQISSLGLDPYSLESKGLLRFVRLPIMYSVEELCQLIPKLIDDYKPDVLIMDSINALLIPISGREGVAFRNMIYDMPKATNSLVVLTAEACEETGYAAGDVAYVADTILVLKQQSEGGLISRVLEIVKARGASISINELPFTIAKGVGFKVFTPPILEELGGEGGELDLGCEALRNTLGHIHSGWHIYLSYQLYSLPAQALILPIIIHVANDLRGLFVSYKYPPEVLERMLVRVLTQYGLGREESRNVVRKHFIFKSFNPHLYSISELVFREFELIDRYKVSSIVFQGVEVVGRAYPSSRFFSYLYNQLNYLRHRGLLTIRIGEYVNEELHKLNASLADVFIDYKAVEVSGGLGFNAYVWRRGSKMCYLLTQDVLDSCCREIASISSMGG